jgi:hypothetical protein
MVVEERLQINKDEGGPLVEEMMPVFRKVRRETC